MEGLFLKYFVLKPSGDDIYAKASRQAMEAYADVIEKENPEMAINLRHWVDAEIMKTRIKNEGIGSV